MTTVVASSTEYIWVPVRSDHPITGPVDLSSYTVDVAFLAVGGDPQVSDWKTAAWESTTKLINGLTYYLARLKIGPAGSVTLTAGTNYTTFVRVTTGTETPVVFAGMVQAI